MKVSGVQYLYEQNKSDIHLFQQQYHQLWYTFFYILRFVLRFQSTSTGLSLKFIVSLFLSIHFIAFTRSKWKPFLFHIPISIRSLNMLAESLKIVTFILSSSCLWAVRKGDILFCACCEFISIRFYTTLNRMQPSRKCFLGHITKACRYI